MQCESDITQFLNIRNHSVYAFYTISCVSAVVTMRTAMGLICTTSGCKQRTAAPLSVTVRAARVTSWTGLMTSWANCVDRCLFYRLQTVPCHFWLTPSLWETHVCLGTTGPMILAAHSIRKWATSIWIWRNLTACTKLTALISIWATHHQTVVWCWMRLTVQLLWWFLVIHHDFSSLILMQTVISQAFRPMWAAVHFVWAACCIFIRAASLFATGKLTACHSMATSFLSSWAYLGNNQVDTHRKDNWKPHCSDVYV